MPVPRDKWDQYDKSNQFWTDAEWRLFFILEEIPTDENEDKTITAYMADVLDLVDDLKKGLRP